MKTIFKSFACAAAAALALASCAKENLVPDDGETDGKKLVKVHFSAETTDPASSRATLTPDEGETAFAAAWETGDEISVKYANDSERQDAEGTTTASWKETSFESSLPEYMGMWIYDAAYPVPDATDSHVDFGPARTQKGNSYNSKYDIMIGSATAENAAAGKDDSGNDIVFQMERQTSIAYFHFTSGFDEAITSATLTVSGEGAAIASNYAYVSDFSWAAAEDCQSITVTFPEEAPNAQDFQLWFNVLETPYESMSLTVETATKTFTISKATDGVYEKGKLYKVKKDGIAWEDKSSESGKTYAYKKISSQSELTDGSYLIVSEDYSFAVAGSKTATDMIKGGAGTAIDIIGDVIAYSADLALDSFEINSVEGGFSIKGSKCGYIGYSLTSNNGLQGNASTIYVNAISVNGGVATVTTKNSASTTYTLCCNPNNNNPLVKYYKTVNADYKDLSLYKYQLVDASALPTYYSITFGSVIGGILSASITSAEEGTEITLTATPDEGYEFTENSWKVVAADASEITVTDGKFIMPASDVTVTASFVRKPYLNAVASKTTISADGETVTVTVDTKVDGGWTAESSDETNFTIGNKTATTFDVTVSKNETEAAREATITVTAGAQTKTITLKQNATGTSEELGETYTWNMASGDFGTASALLPTITKGTPELSWSANYTWGTETKYINNDNIKGIQIGSSTNYCTSFVLATESYSGLVKSIEINGSIAKSGKAVLSVKVNGVALKYNGAEKVSLTTTATDYSFTTDTPISGKIEITITNTAKAFYLKSIVINSAN